MAGHGRGNAPLEKAKDFKGTFGKVVNYIGRYKIAVVAVMICAVCSAVFSIVSPKVLGKATTNLAEGTMSKIAGTGGIDFDYIGHILLIGVVCNQLSFQSDSGVYNVNNYPEALLQAAKRNC